MQYKTWKAIDVALTELENRVGLPDFSDLASEIGKALRTPPTHVADSIEIRKTRLQKAKKDHALEMKSIKFKSASIAAELTPTAIKDAKEKCKTLTEAVRLALVERDIASADAALESLILDFPLDETVAGLCEDVERVASSVRDEEDRKKTKLLSPVAALSAVASSDGKAKVVVSWAPESSGLATEYRVVRENLLTQKVSPAYTCAVSPFEDEEVVLGMPYCYTVVPCYHGVVSEGCAVTTSTVVAVSPVVSFNVYGEGMKGCAVAHITWKLPAYDETIQLSLQLERVCGCARKKIEVESCQGECADGDVVVGETYRYELTLTVSGRQLDPVVREVTIRELPELPVVEASCYYQEGRHWLRVEWPEGVSEVCLTDERGRSVYYTKEDYDKRRVAIPQTFAETELEVQAIRRFGPTKMAFGPKRKVWFTDSRSTLQVSIEHDRRGAFSFFKWRQNISWGLKIDFGGGILPQMMQVSVEDEGEKRVFTISGEQIKQNEFMPFPAHWGVKSGAIIDVLPSDGLSVTYLTSQKIP